MPITEKEVLGALGKVQEPDFKKDIVTLGWVEHIVSKDGTVAFDLTVPTPLFDSTQKLKEAAVAAVRSLAGVSKVEARLDSKISAQPPSDKPNLKGVKNIVAIGSGKGGVGKSTVTVNLAVGLAAAGARVGLVDADIYGPTIPIMMGARKEEIKQKDGRIIPIEAHGVKFMSMGFLAAGNQPLIWRGPMAHRAVQESLMNVDWGDLDYMFIDMPPGTGDVHLTLVQTVSLAGAVIVSTPQDVGLTISMKTFKMFEQTKVHPLGIIENMSFHICSHCGEREEIFGHGIVRKEAEQMKIPFLGEIPLDTAIREHADRGVPVIVSDPGSTAAKAYRQILEKLAAQVSLHNHYAKPIRIIEEPDEPSAPFSV